MTLSLIPHLKQMIPDVSVLLNNCIDTDVEGEIHGEPGNSLLSRARTLMLEGLDLFDPQDYANLKTFDKFEEAYQLLIQPMLKKQEQEEKERREQLRSLIDQYIEYEDPSDQPVDLEPPEQVYISEDLFKQLEFMLALSHTLFTSLFLYQGDWKQAQEAIKEALKIAARLVKENRSISNLYLQGMIKAFHARVLFSTDHFSQGIKMAQSAIRLGKQALKKGQQEERKLARGRKALEKQAKTGLKSAREQKNSIEISESEKNQSELSSLLSELSRLEQIEKALLLFIQRESLKLAEIFLDEGDGPKAMELFRQSGELAKDINASSTVYSRLFDRFPDFQPVLEKLLGLELLEESMGDIVPDKDRKAAGANTEADYLDGKKRGYRARTGLPDPALLTMPMQLIRIKALLLKPEPELFDYLDFFHALFLLLKTCYQENIQMKSSSEEVHSQIQKETEIQINKLDNKAIVKLADLYVDFIYSDFFTEMAGHEYDGYSENVIYEDDTLHNAFLDLRNKAEKEEPLSPRYDVMVDLYPKESALRLQLRKWGRIVDTYITFYSFGRGGEYEVYTEFYYTYLYAVSLINISRSQYNINQLQKDLFDINRYFGLYLMEYYQYSNAQIFLEQALEWTRNHHVYIEGYFEEDMAQLHEALAAIYEDQGDYMASQYHAEKGRRLRKNVPEDILFW